MFRSSDWTQTAALIHLSHVFTALPKHGDRIVSTSYTSMAEASSAPNDLEIFRQLEEYPWDNDKEFQVGGNFVSLFSSSASAILALYTLLVFTSLGFLKFFYHLKFFKRLL